LARRAMSRPERIVTNNDLKALGGVKGGLREHVGSLVRRLFPDRKEMRAFQRLMTTLFQRQPDGALTTALLPVENVANEGVGRTPLEDVLAKAAGGEWRLLRVSSLRLGGAAEGRGVSLGHDALAQVAAEWDDEFKRAARVLRLVAATAGSLLLALLM